MSNFKTVPGFPKYEMSEIGLIRSIKTKSVVKPDNKGRTARLYDNKGERITINVAEVKEKLFSGNEIEDIQEAKLVAKKKADKTPKEKKEEVVVDQEKIDEIKAMDITKSEKIRQLSALGLKNAQVAKIMNCIPQYVYNSLNYEPKK